MGTMGENSQLENMTPTQHFGDLQVAFAQLLFVGLGQTFWSKTTPGVHHAHQPLSV